MTNLLLILGVLFLSLFIVVKVAEKYAKPVSAEQQSKLSRVAMILLSIIMVASLIRHYFGAA